MSDTFIDEIFNPFYSNIDAAYLSTFIRGQVFWTHYSYTNENLEFWRPREYDSETKTSASSFIIDTSTSDAFRRKTPLVAPKLEIDEEFVVTRAKRRPVILISPPPEKIDIRPVRSGSKYKIHRNLCIVAPLYSVVDANGKSTYPNELIDRTRKMEYPNLFFLPGEGRLRHSFCRLESIQAIYKTRLEATEMRLSEEVSKVFFGQVEFFMTGSSKDDEYSFYREEILKGT